MTALISPEAFTSTVSKLRSFFLNLGFLEVHTQNRLSILAACEDPTTVSTFEYAGNIWPLPQTGQMWLEYELLKNPALSGVFCVSTSYRLEPNPVKGRHDLIFPMFEFEAPGTMSDLESLERQLCEYLGFGNAGSFKRWKYEDAADTYEVKEIGHEEEFKLCSDNHGVCFLTDFPYSTSPFWNMKKNGTTANKIDVLLKGMETIGSAERSSNPIEMREQFHTISDGGYAGLLYDIFGKERVEAELEAFLANEFFPRFGGGIGLTRLIRALTL
jgi:aspartyl/asparaginyl-tRNA synthetase